MALIEGWFPPTRENWEWMVWFWQFFPLVTTLQWITDFYPQGRTSIDSRFNIPGAIGWATMEVPGFLTVLYVMRALPAHLNSTVPLPVLNWVMAGMFTVHYLYRALLAPLVLNPSMSPIHPMMWLSACTFQIVNGMCIGGWLGGYGPRTVHDWRNRSPWIVLMGMVIWAMGLVGNYYHDDELRQIRREAMRKPNQNQNQNQSPKRQTQEKGENDVGTVDKVYMMPRNGLFRWILYPHYVCEWIEWTGFWIMGGWHFVPARNFVVNEISTMTPRALQGRRWYRKRFGEKEVGGRTALIPGVL